MSNQLTGTVHKIEPVQSRQSGDKTYKSQEMILSCGEEVNGKWWDNFVKMTAKSDKTIQQLSGLKEGQKITAKFNIRGFNGAKGNYTGIEIWAIEVSNDMPQSQANPVPVSNDNPESLPF